MDGVSRSEIFSLPESVFLKLQNLETPTTKMAQTILAGISDASLNRSSKLLKACHIISVVGTAVAFYFVYIPGVVLGGISLVACLLGKEASRKEQVIRCQNICIEMENEIKEFKEKCKEIELKSLFFKNAISLERTTGISLEESKETLAFKKSIETFIKLGWIDETDTSSKAVLARKIQESSETLKNYHDLLFGEVRCVEKQTISTYWIRQVIQVSFVQIVKEFLLDLSAMRDALNQLGQDQKRDKVSVSVSYLLPELDELFNPTKVSYSEICSKSTSSDEAPERVGIIEKAEIVRRNLAAFRLSLTI